MLKKSELSEPNSCMSRARDDEMTFVVLERDVAAAETIRFWCRERVKLGKNKWGDSQIVEAMGCAIYIDAMRARKSTPESGEAISN